MYQGGSIELIKIKAVFHFRTHFRKNLEVGNPCAGARALEKPVFFGGRDSNFGNSILNNFLPENTSLSLFIRQESGYAMQFPGKPYVSPVI